MRRLSDNRKKEVYNITGGRCYYCGQKIKFNEFQIDHFIPKAYGGQGGDNLVPACADCNMAKADKTIEEFRTTIGSYHDNFQIRVLAKYVKIKKTPVIFYFEKKNLQYHLTK